MFCDSGVSRCQWRWTYGPQLVFWRPRKATKRGFGRSQSEWLLSVSIAKLQFSGQQRARRGLQRECLIRPLSQPPSASHLFSKDTADEGPQVARKWGPVSGRPNGGHWSSGKLDPQPKEVWLWGPAAGPQKDVFCWGLLQGPKGSQGFQELLQLLCRPGISALHKVGKQVNLTGKPRRSR